MCDCDPPHFSRLQIVTESAQIRKLLIFVCPLALISILKTLTALGEACALISMWRECNGGAARWFGSSGFAGPFIGKPWCWNSFESHLWSGLENYFWVVEHADGRRALMFIFEKSAMEQGRMLTFQLFTSNQNNRRLWPSYKYVPVPTIPLPPLMSINSSEPSARRFRATWSK